MDAIIKVDLRKKFDEIDHEFVKEGGRPYCNFHIAEAHAGWRKGWAVIEKYPGAESYEDKNKGGRPETSQSVRGFSWAKVAEETGCRDVTIKSWVGLAKKIGKGEDKFKAWAKEAQARFLGQLERKLLSGRKGDQEISCKIKPRIYLESWETWLPKQPQCDLLVTDPPYSTDIEDIEEFAQSWLPVALSKLKSTGRAYIFIGAYPREIAAYLNVSFPNQLLVWEYRNTLGPMPLDLYILNWQAVLYYKRPDAQRWKDDILLDHTAVQNVGQERPSKHQWQKPMKLAEMFIQQATDEGNLILDPFSGTGTFLLAAGSLGRNAIGCDISPDMVKIAEKRGCKRG
jgi:hypothetical protein